VSNLHFRDDGEYLDISWDSQNSLCSYGMSINGHIVNSSIYYSNYSILKSKVSVGSEISVFVKGYESDNVVSSKKASVIVNQLDKPSLSIDKLDIKWEPVLNADSYYVKDSHYMRKYTTETTYSLADAKAGQYTIIVEAMGLDCLNSSSVITFNKLEKPNISINNGLVLLENGKYSVTIDGVEQILNDNSFELKNRNTNYDVLVYSMPAQENTMQSETVIISNFVYKNNYTAYYGTQIEDSVIYSGVEDVNVIYIPEYITGVSFDKVDNDLTIIASYIPESLSRIKIKEIIVPDYIENISYSAFCDCDNLTKITLPFVDDGSEGMYLGYIFGGYDYTYVPNTLKEVIITSAAAIGENAFYDCYGLISVTIGDGVTAIGANAFYGCSGLTKIELPNSVTTIGGCAFEGCSGLTEIDIPNSVTTIGGYAFAGCSGLTEIEIPNSVTTIGEYAFSSCSGLTEIDIPNNVTTIDGGAFSDCSGLMKIEIPNSVTTIDYYAFYGCSGLTEIEIPNSVTTIGGGALEGCSNLTKITLPFVDEFLTLKKIVGSYYDSSSDSYKVAPSTLKEVIITGGTTIGYNAFYNCSGITKIALSNTVTTIGESAFSRCSGLTEIEIPNSVTTIGGDAFSGCSELTEIEIPNSVTTIGYYAFSGCSNLTKITLPFVGNGSDAIYFGCIFDSNSYLNTYIPDTLKEVIITSAAAIGENAFYNCSGITKIELPNTVTTIGENAFYGCNNLSKVNITDIAAWCNIEFSNSLSNPLNYAGLLYLNNNLVTILNIPSSVKSIKEYAFAGCSGLTEIEIPNSVTTIGCGAFAGCSGLTEIEIPNNVTTIGEYAFYNCSGLTEIEIPNSVTTIGGDAFADCSGLTEIEIPNSVTTIGGGAFDGCNNLAKITLPFVGNGNDETFFGYIFGCDGDSSQSLYIPSSLKEVIITGVTTIDGGAFEGCSGLTKIEIQNSVTTIDGGAFAGCSGLTEIEIPNSVTTIGGGAFKDCYGLISITIGDGVTAIGKDAFSGCENLTSVNIADVSAWCNIEFSNSISNPLCYAKNLYLNNNLVTILNIPSSVTAIKKHAFDGCKSLTSVTIGDGVTAIGKDAFSDCSGLTDINIPNSVTTIGESAFSGCRSLSSIIIPIGVIEIGNDVFYSCSSIIIYCNQTSEPQKWCDDWDVYSSYSSTSHSWRKRCTVYWYSETQPISNGNYWHYVDGEIVIWEKKAL